MSLLQLLGFTKCKPIYEVHTLPNLFTLQTRFTSAIQQYVDCFTVNDIDEHWLILRDRYSGHNWAAAGLIKKFEQDANQLESRLYYGEMEDRITGGWKNLRSSKAWKSFNLDQFRKYELNRDWPETLTNKKTLFNGIEVDRAYFEVSIQFKFLWIAGALKEEKTKKMLSGLGLRSGR